MKRLWKNSKGQSMVEFALVLPLMLIILLGIIDLGFMFFYQFGLSSMVKDVSRAASIGQTSTQITEIVRRDSEMIFTPTSVNVSGGQYVATGSDASQITVSIAPGLSQRKKGESIGAEATYTYVPISFIFPQKIVLSAKSFTLVEETQ